MTLGWELALETPGQNNPSKPILFSHTESDPVKVSTVSVSFPSQQEHEDI